MRHYQSNDNAHRKVTMREHMWVEMDGHWAPLYHMEREQTFFRGDCLTYNGDFDLYSDTNFRDEEVILLPEWGAGMCDV